MNAQDILKYGNRTFLGALDGLPYADWTTPDVCGYWSVKDIVAHLASYEWALVDILTSLPDGAATPLLEHFKGDPQGFNDTEVGARQQTAAADVLADYQAAHAQVTNLIARVPPEQCRQLGILSWYGAAYDLEDFLVYTYYGHKREHAAQIAVFRDTLKR